jgi:hypothetical protein
MKIAANLMLGAHNELRDVVEDNSNAYINSIVKIDPKFKIMSNLLNPNVDHLQYLVVF